MIITYITKPISQRYDSLVNKKDVAYALDFDNHNPEKASIYVFRSKHDPTHVYRDLYLDGKFVTKIGGCGYFFREVEPGEHTITAYSRFGTYVRTTIDA